MRNFIPILFVAAALLAGYRLPSTAQAQTTPPPQPSRDEQLQAAFQQFPLLTQSNAGNGAPKFQTLRAMPPVVINGRDFYGFKFTVPQRQHAEDFVWAMIQPPNLGEWYIVPETGEMHGFERYRTVHRTNYVNMSDLRPLNQENLILQGLDGTDLTNGQNYLIWWSRTGNPRPESVAFTFAPLGPKSLNSVQPIEKALGLVRAPRQP